MTEREAVAHQEITQLEGRFADAVNRADYDLFRSVWTSDCDWRFLAPMNMQTKGIEAATTKLRELLGQWEFFAHLVHSGTIELAEATATSRWYIDEIGRNKDRTKFYRNVGLYEDELVFEGDVWKFAKRTYHYIWLDQSEFGGDAVPLSTTLKGVA